ncbi:MAG TPA: nucleotidyl transferase AbiEii/AbiGii toxin family protein [Thermoanaerobaculia bacterium]
MALAREPASGLAAKVLPPPLYGALRHVFAAGLDGVMLVGGTALAGYYAGHRRSDDIDLFTAGERAQRAAILAVRSLVELGASFADERSSAHFHDVTCHLDGHDFTVQVVLDSNVFAIRPGQQADDHVLVAALETLLKMKAATLVSRASEKDLYDLTWFFRQDDGLDVPTLLALGKEVDGGVNGEAVLISLVGTQMRESACDFSLTESAADVHAQVTGTRKALIQGVEIYLRDQAAPPIAGLIEKLR